MDIEIRPIVADEFERYSTSVERAFGSHPRPDEIEEWRRISEPERSLAAFDGGEIVGTAAAFSLDLSVPGAEVPMAAVTAVGVAPTHRRRGLLTMLMRRQLDDVHDRGEPVAGLWASEGSIYQRFGYGLASLAGAAEIDRARTSFVRAPEVPGQIRLLDRAAALEAFPPIHERARATQPGMLSRSPSWWQHLFADLEHWRDGASALFFALYESPEVPEGYVTYRVKQDWSTGVPAGTVRVRELLTVTPEALAALWRYCFDIDLVSKIEAWPRPPDDPLLYLLAEPRRWNLRLGDGLWVRLVDVPAALSARRYRTEGRVVFEVRDTFCPWNEGRYVVEGGPEGASCRATAEPPEIFVDAADLGAAYLGGTPFRVLARAGRVRENENRALERADAMFTWDPLPWCNQLF